MPMLERTYRASRFEEALAQVKRELGPDAVILSSRQVRGGLFGSTTEVEITAAPDGSVPASAISTGRTIARSSEPSGIEWRLIRMGVPVTAARTLCTRIRSASPREPRTMAEVKSALSRALREEMIFGGAAGVATRGRARVTAFVGPTGVGKTTTIAKLAAQAALIDRVNVGLVCIDQFRIGGAEQLGQYAELIGIPMEIADDAESLGLALQKLADADLVFVDTAGRAPRDRGAVSAMAECLHRAGEPVEVHLCMAAAMHDAEMEAVLERLAPLRATKLTMTKVDEAIRTGTIVAAQVLTGLPLAYFTTGQRVPEDIEAACAERLASLLCGEEVN
ncbi:MAG: hypothetical protein HYY06_20765 [Deltaproteobacteria bacterium]|nr:hypothetical protein [Deltaproteobacteria bacterium]